MFLDELLTAQKQGQARGITSICSAHPYVLKQTLNTFETPLIEATCNQVNQFGGYTGMTPKDFVKFVHGIAQENQISVENICLGGDHLGPSVWRAEPAEAAMSKAETLIHDYVQAGFVKIHLDCSMPLADDPQGALDVELSARRAARLAKVAEAASPGKLRYVIGSEVPIPGGAVEHEESLGVTKPEFAQQAIEVTRQAFFREGLHSAWERVIALVVQPGVEFGDDFVFTYQPDKARELASFIETQPLNYEAHSTDYQTGESLTNMVHDHFAILKVGPALTFAYREGVFALAKMEDDLLPFQDRSKILTVIESVMQENSSYWLKYYAGDEREKAFKRQYSLSDRIRYYWADPRVQQAFLKMNKNLNQKPLPAALLKQYVPELFVSFTETSRLTPEKILLGKIQKVLEDYARACRQPLKTSIL